MAGFEAVFFVEVDEILEGVALAFVGVVDAVYAHGAELGGGDAEEACGAGGVEGDDVAEVCFEELAE